MATVPTVVISCLQECPPPLIFSQYTELPTEARERGGGRLHIQIYIPKNLKFHVGVKTLN